MALTAPAERHRPHTAIFAARIAKDGEMHTLSGVDPGVYWQRSA